MKPAAPDLIPNELPEPAFTRELDAIFAHYHQDFRHCRNVFIYFDRTRQDALCRRGFLGLRARETLRSGAHAGAFSELAGPERWYQLR